MSQIFFTSDHHFGHANIIRTCNRPFGSVQEMDEAMIAYWNETVSGNDLVYYIGDFTLKGKNFALSIIPRLRGRIIFLPGSHDSWMPKSNVDFSPTLPLEFRRDTPMLTVKLPDVDNQGRAQTVTLCHYAMRSWPESHYGTWHLFGHHHGRLEPHGLSFDIGVDCWNFRPVSLAYVVKQMATLSPLRNYTRPPQERPDVLE